MGFERPKSVHAMRPFSTAREVPPQAPVLGHTRRMEWARTNTVRAVVVGLLVIFVVAQAVQRDWAWLAAGTALLLLNLVLWREYRASGPSGATTTGAPDEEAPDVDATLSELMGLPGVAEAWRSGPDVWRQVSYLDDEDDLSMPAREVADYAWVTCSDGEWSVAVGDELKPLLDLDLPGDQDPLVTTLAAHRGVAQVHHSDREQYDVVLSAPVRLAELASLAARGLVSHHLEAVRRLST